VLFVNVPIGIAAAAVAPRVLAESRNGGPRHFDVAGAVTVTAGLSLLVYALVDAHQAGWGSVQTLGLGALALALVAAFVAIERRATAPLVPFPGIFRLRTISGVNVTALFVAMALFSMFFFVSLYMQYVLGYDALKAGLSYLPLAGGIIVSAGVASALVTRLGFKPVLVAGLVLTAGGLVWFSRVSPDGSYVGDILFASLLAAVGLGFAFVPMTVAAVSGVRPDEAGLASGLINTSQQVGGALGLAILATIATARTDAVMRAAGGDPAARPDALTEGFQRAFAVGAGFAIVGAILALGLISGRQSRQHAKRRSAARSRPSPWPPDPSPRRPPGLRPRGARAAGPVVRSPTGAAARPPTPRRSGRPAAAAAPTAAPRGSGGSARRGRPSRRWRGRRPAAWRRATSPRGAACARRARRRRRAARSPPTRRPAPGGRGGSRGRSPRRHRDARSAACRWPRRCPRGGRGRASAWAGA
jgi:hypothetical protein